MVARAMEDLWVIGCERGRVFLFKNFELVYEAALHKGPIRSLAIDHSLLYSGGMDGRLCVSEVGVDGQRYFVVTVEEYNIKQ
jgi:hypothetical protein